MLETILTLLIVAAAGLWFARWLRASASGKTGCACSGCGKCRLAKSDEHAKPQPF